MPEIIYSKTINYLSNVISVDQNFRAKALTFARFINPVKSIFAFTFVRTLSVLAALGGIRTLKRPFQALIDV